MRTMGLRARRKVINALDSTGSEAYRTSCFRMIHNLSANKRWFAERTATLIVDYAPAIG